MNANTAKLIHILHDYSTKKIIPVNVRIYIEYLNDLSSQWENKNKLAINSTDIGSSYIDLSEDIGKTIFALIEKISGSQYICFDLISLFSEIVVSYMDELGKIEGKLDGLAELFQKMKVSTGLLDRFSTMHI